MAIVRTLDMDAWNEWVDSRPESVRAIASMYTPDKLYRMASGHRCTIYSYSEDGTVTVAVTGEYNLVSFSRRVFGIDPSSLVECDLPSKDEELGDLGMSVDEVKDMLQTIADGKPITGIRDGD